MSHHNENLLRSYNVQTLKKFPTIAVEVSFLQTQKEEDIEARNLVAKMLPELLAVFPTKIATKSYFSDLYAAKVYSGTRRNGDKHEVTFQFVFTDPKVINDDDYQLDDLILCIQRVLLEPGLENGAFVNKVLNVESNIMQARITNMYDDKSTYAQIKLLEHMFKDTPFAIRPYGKPENYGTLTAAAVYAKYQQMLTEDTMQIAVVGNVDEKTVTEKLEKIFANIQKESKPLETTTVTFNKRDEAQRFVEVQKLNQTKLHIGYHVPTTIRDKDYFNHRLAVEILGGGAQSKLFQNVREKASLAYSVSASLDAYAEAMYIFAGVDHDKIEQAHTIILEQINQMLHGEIMDEEISMAKNNILHRMSMLQDNQLGMISLQKQLAELHNINTFDEWKKRVMDVTVNDIIEAVTTWKEDTVFILTNDTEEGEV